MPWRASDLIDRLAGEQRTALVFIDEYGHRRDYTFREVAVHSQRYAAVLRAFGVAGGERAYVSLSTTAKCVFTLLALERIGAEVVLDAARAPSAATIVANRVYRPQIDALREQLQPQTRFLLIGEECEGWARLDTLAQAGPAPRSEVETGAADATLDSARDGMRELLGAGAIDTVWCALHVEDENWFERAIAAPWLCGSAAVAHNADFDASERLDLVRELDVTILLQREHDYRAQLALADPERFKMPRLRRCLIAGNRVDEELQSKWNERFGLQLTSFAAV